MFDDLQCCYRSCLNILELSFQRLYSKVCLKCFRNSLPYQEQTEKGLPQAIAKLVKAYHDGGFNSKVNLIMGDTYGSAYVAMGARSISDADMVFAWDDAKVGMMEAEKAANILFAAEGEKATEKQAAAYEGKQNAVTSAAARGSVDAVIAPAQTRKHLIMAFSML